MDRKRLDQLHSAALSWGQWCTGGRDRVGIGAVWPDIPHRTALEAPRSHRNGVKRQKSLYPLPQPHSSRNKPQARPLTGRIDEEYTQIQGIAVRQPEPIQHIIVFLYLRGMAFRDVSLVTGLESKKIGRLKSCFLDSIDSVVR
jgi:hypothetical protein